MNNILDLLQPDAFPIDVVMVVIVILSGLFQAKYAAEIKLSAAWKTLAASIFFCSIYVLIKIFAEAAGKDEYMRWFFSYLLATSMYELLFKKFVKRFFPDDAN